MKQHEFYFTFRVSHTSFCLCLLAKANLVDDAFQTKIALRGWENDEMFISALTQYNTNDGAPPPLFFIVMSESAK